MTEAAKQEGAAQLEARADRAAAAGDAPEARRLLERVTALEPGRGEPWLKLMAMCRMQGDLPAALAAVSGALRLEPLGFLPLLLQASLLDQAGRGEEAGEVYGYALAQMPDEVPALMEIKRAQIENETLRGLYLDIGALADCGPDDPRLPALADRVAAFIEAAAAQAEGVDGDPPISDELIELLDEAFAESFPCAPRLFELLEERGWVGWTNIRREGP